MSGRFNINRWITVLYRRKKLKNHKFSILSNRCIGGVVTHAVGERFRSPTVNLVIDDLSFLVFCRYVKEYSNCVIELPVDEECKLLPNVPFPIGIIRGKPQNLPDIPIYFVHFKTFEEAKEKWEKRYKRIEYEHICVMMDGKISTSEQVMDEFEKLPYERKVIFTHRYDPVRWPSNFHYSFYTPQQHGNGVLYRLIKKGIFRYQWMEEFDVVQWLNDGTIRKSDLKLY